MKKPILPLHPARQYVPVRCCIYCRATEPLGKEHIVPYSVGGNWTIPKASCADCAKITAKFEGEFGRTILGPLRMLYNMPTRRPKDRPRFLPLKVKYPTSEDWEIAQVDRRICPFLILMPLYPPPDALTGQASNGDRSAATAKFWIRGGGFWPDRDAQLQALCEALGATQVMPTGTVHTHSVCLTLAKVAHAFATAELGLGTFDPFLCEMIRGCDLSDRAAFIGGIHGDDETASENTHEVEIVTGARLDPTIVVVRVRLFAILGFPAYHVVVGRHSEAALR